MVVRYAVSVTARVGAVSDYLRGETVAERKSRLVDSDRPAIETASGRWSVEGMAFSADTKHAAYERAAGAASVCGSRARRTTPAAAADC